MRRNSPADEAASTGLPGRMNPIYNSLRPVIRQTFVRVWPAPLLARRRIAVFGLPRSGTSWLAKAISLSRGVSYYFEPDTVLDESHYYKYLPEAAEEQFLSDHLRRSLHGKVVGEYTIAEQGIRELALRPFAHTVLVKLVRFSLSLNWFARNFPDVRVIQILRHPVPQFLSWSQRGWDPGYALGLLLRQPELIEGPLRSYKDVMQGAETYWEMAGAFWGAVARMQYDSHRPGWYLFEHEWYCYDAEARVRWLIEDLGMEWNSRIEGFIYGKSGNPSRPGYGSWRDPFSEIHKWEGRLSEQELRQLESTIKEFGLPFYPSLNPEAFYSSFSPALPRM